MLRNVGSERRYRQSNCVVEIWFGFCNGFMSIASPVPTRRTFGIHFAFEDF